MSVRERLRQLPALVINVPGSDERWDQFMRYNKTTFGEIWRYPAAPIVNKKNEALQWRRLVMGSKEHRDPKDFYSRVNVFQAKTKTLNQERKQHEYAATMSLFRTVVSATQFGLRQGWPRFLIVEDDAAPREDILDSLEDPPPDAEMIVWGGAIPMGAHNYDDREYQRGRQSKYSHIKKPQNRYIATAYEMTAHAAGVHWSSLMSHPHAVDCAWWYTMDSVVSYSVFPTAFTQVGPSDRIDKIKNGATSR